MNKKSILALLLVFAALLSMSTAAWAEEPHQSRAVIGANLNEEEINTVYGLLGVPRGSVPELRVTNAEERQALEGYVDSAVIGTRSISSVYVELLEEGSGMNVSTCNITWCTGEMYISALATAGITDAKIVVAAPYAVSGTAALTGIYKAYEDMTGRKLDDLAKLVSTQELTVTGELAEEIGSMDSTSIVNELKLMLNETVNMSDGEIREQVKRIADSYGVNLTDKQIQQLIDLCRSLEGLNPQELRSRVEEAQDTLRKVSRAKNEVVGFVQSTAKVIRTLKSFFDRLSELFGWGD